MLLWKSPGASCQQAGPCPTDPCTLHCRSPACLPAYKPLSGKGFPILAVAQRTDSLLLSSICSEPRSVQCRDPVCFTCMIIESMCMSLQELHSRQLEGHADASACNVPHICACVHACSFLAGWTCDCEVPTQHGAYVPIITQKYGNICSLTSQWADPHVKAPALSFHGS